MDAPQDACQQQRSSGQLFFFLKQAVLPSFSWTPQMSSARLNPLLSMPICRAFCRASERSFGPLKNVFFAIPIPLITLLQCNSSVMSKKAQKP